MTETQRKAQYGKNQGMNWIGRTRRMAIYLRDDFRCLYCGVELRDLPAGSLTLDHLMLF